MITADEGIRGNKKIPLKANVDKALESCPNVRKTIVKVQRTSADINWNPEKDIWYSEQNGICILFLNAQKFMAE